MCGITAYIAFSSQPRSLVQRMTGVISHRGPDDEGYAFFSAPQTAPDIYGGTDTPEHCYHADYRYCPESPLDAEDGQFSFALAHRRLAIVDVSAAGHQPMSSEDGQHWIVYNGEVYNYVELREELEKQGFRFTSHTDTEVVLAAYRAWGRDCLSRFNGMFAFVIYDGHNNQFFIARDRFGIKPLYYWISSNGIAFASEIKQFTMLPGWKAVVNGQRAYDFLNWGVSDHTSETFFKHVYQFRGGEALVLPFNAVHNGNYADASGQLNNMYRWYHLAPAKIDFNEHDAATHFRELLYDSVRLRLRADVPVGSCLSGGLDSSSIVCVMDALLKANKDAAGDGSIQKTFSACSDIERFDEKKYVDIVVKQTGVNAHYVYPSLEVLFQENEKLVWYQDEPYNTTSAYAQWNVFRLAAENDIVVMLDGQGADEQLAGYHRFFGTRFTTLFRQIKWFTLISEIMATKRLHGHSGKLAAMQVLSHFIPQALKYFLLNRYGMSSTRPDWLNLETFGARPEDPLVSLGVKTDTISKRSYWELTSTNLQKLLHWEDRSSMAHSIEARLPFLDYRLVESVLAMPDHLKISQGITKVVLREGMRGILPEQIRNRMDKLGFVTPEQVWVCEMKPDEFKNRIADVVNRYSGIFNSNATRLAYDIIDRKRKYSSLPWRIISFGMWMDTFNVQH